MTLKDGAIYAALATLGLGGLLYAHTARGLQADRSARLLSDLGTGKISRKQFQQASAENTFRNAALDHRAILEKLRENVR